LDDPLPGLFADVIKSWLVLEYRSSVGTMANRLATMRVLWEALVARRQGQQMTFSWEGLCEEDLRQTELFLRNYYGPSAAYTHTNDLIAFVRFLMARRLCRPLYYTSQIPNIGASNRHTLAGQEKWMAMLPTKKALEGVADIFSRYATEPPDRLRICALAVLAVTGFRIGELLTLPLDCEVKEERGGKQRYGLRYYKEKARGAEKIFEVRWLTPIGAELASQAIAEIRDITEPFRERARVLEQNPERVPLPSFSPEDRMTAADVMRILGLKNKKSVFLLIKRCEFVSPPKNKTGIYFRGREVEAYLLSKRVRDLWTVNRRDGIYQMLSETLLLAPRFFFKPNFGTNPLLVEPLGFQQLSSFLRGKGVTKSAFERFGIREGDGSFCQMNSHQFRHWLNTIADKGGLPVELLTRWMGREHPRDTDAYRHLTTDERIAWVKAGIRGGEMSGKLVKFYNALARAEQDDFLDGRIQAVHFTPFGVCTHDFAVSPCSYHLACLRGCPDFLRAKGNQQERANLIQLKGRIEKAREIAIKQVEGGDELARAWIDHNDETLKGIREALSADDLPTIEDESLVSPFSGGSKKSEER